MPAHFNLTLDTLGPAISAISGTFTGTEVQVTVDCLDLDAAQVKLWGDVEGAAAELDAPWQAFVTGQAIVVAVTAGDGPKTINARLRDDVWNEGAADAVIVTVDTTAPVVTITVAPDRTKISKVEGRDKTIFTWSADSDIDAYEVCVVPAMGSTHDQGTPIPVAGGSVNMTGGPVVAGAPVQSTIDGEDLDAVVNDGDHITKVFAQDAAGNWSL